ncbi:hypothetical protein Gotur_033077, partial [Gossypium turneri]
GFWHTTRQLQAVLTCQNHFQAQETDILLYPNTDNNHPLLSENPHILVPFLEYGLYIDSQVPNFTTFTSPRLFATHLPLVSLPESAKNSSCKLVYLRRNPKDTFVSLWHFTNKLSTKDMGSNSLEETFDNSPDAHFSNEEETRGAVDGIQKLCSFENLSNLEINKTGKLASGEEYKAFFRRGEVGDAKNHLTPQMIEKLDQITEQKLYGYGLKF